MSYLLSLSVAPGSSVTKDFDPPLDMGIQAKVDFGESLTPAEVAIWSEPRVLRVGERRRKPGPPAIMGWFGGPFLVCEAVKEKLELLGPGNCRFKSFETWGLDERRRECHYGTYYWVMPPSLDAVVIEATCFSKGMGREGYERSGGDISLSPDAKCVVNKRAIGNHHLWRLPQDFGTTPNLPVSTTWRTYFCSDALRDFLKAERLDGWSFDKKCVDRVV